MGRIIGLCSICLRYVDPRARFCDVCRVRVDRERHRSRVGGFRSKKRCGDCRQHGHDVRTCPKSQGARS